MEYAIALYCRIIAQIAEEWAYLEEESDGTHGQGEVNVMRNRGCVHSSNPKELNAINIYFFKLIILLLLGTTTKTVTTSLGAYLLS